MDKCLHAINPLVLLVPPRARRTFREACDCGRHQQGGCDGKICLPTTPRESSRGWGHCESRRDLADAGR